MCIWQKSMGNTYTIWQKYMGNAIRCIATWQKYVGNASKFGKILWKKPK